MVLLYGSSSGMIQCEVVIMTLKMSIISNGRFAQEAMSADVVLKSARLGRGCWAESDTYLNVPTKQRSLSRRIHNPCRRSTQIPFLAT